jgi:fatty-acyl-CoA synthase
MLDWLSAPSREHGIRFACDDGSWDLWSYERLAAAVYGAVEQLRDFGVRRSDVVGIVTSTGPMFVAAYFATLAAGAVPAPLVPPTLFDEEQRYIRHCSALVRAAAARVVTEPALAETVGRVCLEAECDRGPLVLDLQRAAPSLTPSRPAELALLQFTSGSSGTPRGVRVTYGNLEANIGMIRDWIDWGPQDAGAHWLPLYHDMGLIGCLLTPAIFQRDLWILRPEQFVREPQRWLDCFGRRSAAFTAGPNFCFAYAAKRIDPAALDGSDFSGWRAAIVGAERLDPAALGRFCAMLEPYGFRAETFLPAYGLAEATLAVTGVPADRVPRVLKPDWGELAMGNRPKILARADLGTPEIGDGDGWLVGCGAPLATTSIGVVGDAGAPVPQGAVGELEVTGPTVALGYLASSASGVVTTFAGGGVRTGDLGFIDGGELFVVGRLGDAVKVRGRTLYAEDVESKLAAIPGVPPGRCVVVPGLAEGAHALIAIVEADAGPWVGAAARVLTREAGRDATIRIFAGARGSILRTSSGKPRRRVIWRALRERELDLELLHETGASRLA